MGLVRSCCRRRFGRRVWPDQKPVRPPWLGVTHHSPGAASLGPVSEIGYLRSKAWSQRSSADHPRAGGGVPHPRDRRVARPGDERAPQQQRDRLRDLPLASLLRTCAGLRGSARQSAEEFATVTALRATAKRVLACESEAAELEAQLLTLVERVAPWLLDQVGVGPVVAGQLLASWSHRGRVHSEAAFAMLGGVAPIEASSGMVVRAAERSITRRRLTPCSPGISSEARPDRMRGASARRARHPRRPARSPRPYACTSRSSPGAARRAGRRAG